MGAIALIGIAEEINKADPLIQQVPRVISRLLRFYI
jgi:hypothetical protein